MVVYCNGKRVGSPFPDDIADAITYNLEDQIGSSVARLDTNGTIIDREEYYPFGDSSLRTFTKKRYRYVGKEKDLESGLYYYGARYYAAWTCRFISIDPLAQQYAHLTPYNNASNNPVTHKDIDGNQTPSEGTTPQNGGEGKNINTSETKTPPDGYKGEFGSTSYGQNTSFIDAYFKLMKDAAGGDAHKIVEMWQKGKNGGLDENNHDEYQFGIAMKEFSYYAFENGALENEFNGKDSSSGFKDFDPFHQTNNSKNYAQQLIDSKNVTFIKVHPNKHTPNDNANADDNMRDAAEGKAVHTSNYGNAPNKDTHLSEMLLKGLLELSKQYTFSIQELAGASHSENSEHYKGKAVDINWLNGIHVGVNHPNAEEFIKRAKELGFNVNNEWKMTSGAHFHLFVK